MGLQDTSTIQEVGQYFNIHPLILEDIINTDHLPKCEPIEQSLFFTLKFPTYEHPNDTLQLMQISLILSPTHLLTFQEGPKDMLIRIKQRLSQSGGRVRQKNMEYLFYILIDYIIDQYFSVMDRISDEIESTEDLLIDHPEDNHITTIHTIKKHIVYLRKYITATSQAVSCIQNLEIRFQDKQIRNYFRDVYDHTQHISESLVTSKELQTTLLEMNMANMNNNMNRVMKTLTIVATLFIPLTFIVGIYGMNFKYMPELNWVYGYPAVWALMLIVALWMTFLIKRKKWL